MEFFSDNKRTMFLYYKDNYYLLNEENETVKPLAPINDAALLKKLKDYRGQIIEVLGKKGPRNRAFFFVTPSHVCPSVFVKYFLLTLALKEWRDQHIKRN